MEVVRSCSSQTFHPVKAEEDSLQRTNMVQYMQNTKIIESPTKVSVAAQENVSNAKNDTMKDLNSFMKETARCKNNIATLMGPEI